VITPGKAQDNEACKKQLKNISKMGKKSKSSAPAPASGGASSKPSPTTQNNDPLNKSPGQDKNPFKFDLTSPGCPQTTQRRQATDADSIIAKPAIARANIAVSTATPDGSPESKAPERKDHVRFPALSLSSLPIHLFNTIG
jgi:hypothetical protein